MKKEKNIEKIINDISHPNTAYMQDNGTIQRIKKGLNKLNNTELGNLSFIISLIIDNNILMDAKLLRKNIELVELKDIIHQNYKKDKQLNK